MRNEFVFFSIISLGLVLVISQFLWPPIGWSLIILIPVLALGYYDMIQTQHTVMRNFPVLGRGRYIFEALRPKIYQYFVESDTDGKPIPRIYRYIVLQRVYIVIFTLHFVSNIVE